MKSFLLNLTVVPFLIASMQLSSCNSSAIKDGLDLVDGVPEKTINTDILGANAFANDGRFGSPAAQFKEVRSVLGLRFVRVLINWDSGIQPSKSSKLNLSFADTLVKSLPSGVDALVVLTGTPAWMAQPGNWDGGDPRATYVQRFVAPIVKRYANHPSIIGFQIWNEPNQVNPHNSIMGFINNAPLYVDMLRAASQVIQTAAPAKLVVAAATTAINQNYPDSLKYNRSMRDAGAQTYADIWAIHFYGKQFENVVRPGGVADFLNGLTTPIWVTETGEQGVNRQLKYGRQVWPFLVDKVQNIHRIYLYQFTEDSPPATTYGLRNLSKTLPVSDLYVHLRERAAN